MYIILRAQESQFAVNATYVTEQAPFFSSSARARLVCKMIEADECLGVPTEVLFLAVNMLDRFFTANPLDENLDRHPSAPILRVCVDNTSLLRLVAIGCFSVRQ
jgi:hypothetical protein